MSRIKGDNRGIGVIGIIVIIALLAVIGVGVYLLFHGKGFGTGNGSGDGEGDGNTQVVTAQETDSEEEANTTEEEQEADKNDEATDTYEGAILKISVIGNDYIYDSEKITIDAFVEICKKTEGDFVVKIKDDNASLNAYNELLKALKENDIDYDEEE